MSQLGLLGDRFPEPAKDIKLNLQSVVGESSLTNTQKWGVAIACAYAARNPEITKATIIDARADVGDEVVEDAKAAAALMAMNNVFYRFRHMIGKESYGTLPARLRMQRLAKPKTGKADFELFCLAVSAINGCEACVRAHEKVVLEGGLSEQNIHDAVRIASTFHAAAVALEMAE